MQDIANGGLLLAVMVLCSVYLYGQSGTAEAHYDTGIKALEGGDLNGAEQQFRGTLKLRPDFFEARQNLAITLAQKGNLREAAAEFRKLIEQRLRSPETHYNLGLVLFQERDSNPALEQFRKALELKPDYPEARNNLGLLLEQMGDFKGAISELQTIIQLHPQYAEARNNLGHVLRRMATLTARLPNIAPPWEYALTFLKPLRISAWHCGGSMTLMGQRWNFAPRRLRMEREELAIVSC